MGGHARLYIRVRLIGCRHERAAVGIRNCRADKADIRHGVIGRWETGDMGDGRR